MAIAGRNLSASQMWPRHSDGREVRLGEIWDTEEFGRIPIEQVNFSRYGSVYVGDNGGHGKYIDFGGTID